MKKILITGCNGYIGQHLMKMLANFSYEVWGIDNKFSNYNSAPENLIEMDIRYDIGETLHDWSDLPYDFDTVIHLAASVKVNESVLKPWEYYDNNVNGTKNLLSKIKFKNFLFASTGAATQCGSPYALSKRIGEDIVEQYCKENNCKFINYRFYNVIGSTTCPPTNQDGLFYNLIQAPQRGYFTLYGDDWNTPDGSCIRDYLHPDEVALSLISGIETPTCKVENLGTGRGFSVKEMIQIFKEVNNCDFELKVLPRRPGDVESMVLKDVSPLMVRTYGIEKLLQYEPQTTK